MRRMSWRWRREWTLWRRGKTRLKTCSPRRGRGPGKKELKKQGSVM